MADWNPSLYLQFDAERTRPAADLLSRIAHLQVEHAVDLGCGPGNSTRLLRAAWPLATIVGIDNSPAMLVQAAQALPDCEFIDADIARWRPAQPPDVIYANASLQWLTDHETLFPHLVNQLADNGTLAVQMPDNWQEPSHTLMRQVASEMGLPDRGRQPLLPPPPGTICSAARVAKLISGAPPIFIPLLLIRRLSTGCRAPGYAPIWQAWTSRPEARFSHAISHCWPHTIRYSVTGRCSCVSHGCLSWRERSPPDRWDRWAEKRSDERCKGSAIPS